MKKSSVTKRSYANAVRTSTEDRAKSLLSQWSVEKTLKEKRLAKKITIKIINAQNIVKIKKMNSKKIMKTIQTKADEMTSVRRLLSENIRVHIRFKKTKMRLQKSENWIKKIVESAIVQRRTYVVLARDVKIKNMNIFNQNKVIQQLIEINAWLHDDLRIERVFWSFKIIREEKVYFTLTIEVVSAKMINRLINDDIIEDYKNKDCEIFVKECRMTQCFNCQQYEYIDKICKNLTRCDHCVDQYLSMNCIVKISIRHRKCAVCQYERHEIWTSKCEVKNFQKRRVQHAYETRLRFYSVDSMLSKSSEKVQWTSVSFRRQKFSLTQRSSISRAIISKVSTLKEFTTTSTSISASRVQKRAVNVNLMMNDNLSQTDDFLMTEKKSAWALTIMNSERREKAFAKSKRDRLTRKLVVENTQTNHTLWQRDLLCLYYSTTFETIA